MNPKKTINKEATISNVLLATSMQSATTGFDKPKFNQKMEQDNWEEVLVDIAHALRAEIVYIDEEISV